MKFMNDSLILLNRNLKHMVRNPENLIMSVALPLMLMLAFVFVFGGAIDTGTEYVNFIVPSIIIVCAGFGSSMVAVTVCHDMVGGLFDRFRSMPLKTSSLLFGHVLGSFFRNAISTAVIISVAFLLGFEPTANFLEWLTALGLISLFLLTISWLSVIVGLVAKTVEAASSFTFTFTFLPYISNAFVPVETMPDWLQPFARYQPLTPLINALRGLLIGKPLENEIFISLMWFSSLLILFYIIAVLVFNKKRET